MIRKTATLNSFIDVQEILDQNRVELEIKATPEECVALAQRSQILKVEDIKVKAILTPGSRPDLFRLKGTMDTHVEQACSVTLTPVKETIHEEFDEILTTSIEALKKAEEAEIEDSMDEPIDLIENNKLDMGEIIAQWLGLSLNPYPRSDAPHFEHIELNEGLTDGKTHTPFSVLQNLKTKE